MAIFTEPRIVGIMTTILHEAVRRYRCALVAYVFMPDHLHVIISGENDHADGLAAMKRFKQRSGYWLLRNRPGIRWQKDFHDHLHRRAEDTDRHIRYVLENPVRAGLVDHWKAYPFRGSMVHDLESWDPRI